MDIPMIFLMYCQEKVNAVFFITGPYLNHHEDLVRRMVEEGHAVGNHTVGHLSLPTLTDEKVERKWPILICFSMKV